MRVVEFMFGLAIAQNILLLTRFSALQFDVEFLEYLFGSLQVSDLQVPLRATECH